MRRSLLTRNRYNQQHWLHHAFCCVLKFSNFDLRRSQHQGRYSRSHRIRLGVPGRRFGLHSRNSSLTLRGGFARLGESGYDGPKGTVGQENGSSWPFVFSKASMAESGHPTGEFQSAACPMRRSVVRAAHIRIRAATEFRRVGAGALGGLLPRPGLSNSAPLGQRVGF